MKSAWVMKASPDPSKLSCAKRMGAIMDREEIIKMAREVGYPLVEYERTPYIPPLLAALLETVAAAQRTWVGLTDEEIQSEWVLTPQNDKAEGIWFGRRIEAKLKDKNNG